MEQGLVEIWRELLLDLLPKLWHAVTATDAFNWNLQQATRLTTFEYDSLLEASGIMVKYGASYACKVNRLECLKQALKERNLTVEITTRLQRKGEKIIFFIAVGKPDFCSPKEQMKANPSSIPTNQNGDGLGDNSKHLLKRLCDERVTEKELVEIAIEDQPLVLVTPTNNNSLLSNKRNCIGIDNSRIECYKEIDMKYCLSNWSYLKGWRSHSCTFLFRPAAEKDTRCKHCFSAYTNINKERHPKFVYG